MRRAEFVAAFHYNVHIQQQTLKDTALLRVKFLEDSLLNLTKGGLSCGQARHEVKDITKYARMDSPAIVPALQQAFIQPLGGVGGVS